MYCYSRVRLAHVTFILTELRGFKNVKNYDGSWVEWRFNKDLPFKQDTIMTLFNNYEYLYRSF
ncbi:hypothetical protein [Flavivirga sp. 57AJ16]|uniref:hypothetical protein n=1 Tax=Flavivirga sp. 57AJ16 TaxID=3025307 RepID=UPI0034DFBBB2